MKNMCLREVYACTHGVGTGEQWIADTVSVLCAGQCKKVLGNVRRCWAMYEGPGHCMKVLGTVRRCWALYEGSGHCKKVLGNVRRC